MNLVKGLQIWAFVTAILAGILGVAIGVFSVGYVILNWL